MREHLFYKFLLICWFGEVNSQCLGGIGPLEGGTGAIERQFVMVAEMNIGCDTTITAVTVGGSRISNDTLTGGGPTVSLWRPVQGLDGVYALSEYLTNFSSKWNCGQLNEQLTQCTVSNLTVKACSRDIIGLIAPSGTGFTVSFNGGRHGFNIRSSFIADISQTVTPTQAPLLLTGEFINGSPLVTVDIGSVVSHDTEVCSPLPTPGPFGFLDFQQVPNDFLPIGSNQVVCPALTFTNKGSIRQVKLALLDSAGTIYLDIWRTQSIGASGLSLATSVAIKVMPTERTILKYCLPVPLSYQSDDVLGYRISGSVEIGYARSANWVTMYTFPATRSIFNRIEATSLTHFSPFIYVTSEPCDVSVLPSSASYVSIHLMFSNSNSQSPDSDSIQPSGPPNFEFPTANIPETNVPPEVVIAVTISSFLLGTIIGISIISIIICVHLSKKKRKITIKSTDTILETHYQAVEDNDVAGMHPIRSNIAMQNNPAYEALTGHDYSYPQVPNKTVRLSEDNEKPILMVSNPSYLALIQENMNTS